MRARISKFERRILAAIFISALGPFLISIVFIPQIVESRLALSLHPRVREQLLASATFFKTFFDAKKREFSARGEAIAHDPVLVRAAAGDSVDDVRARLEQVLADHPELRSVNVYRADGAVMLELEGPADRQGPDFVPKRLSFPLGTGDAPRLVAEFILPAHHLQDRAQAEEISTLYETSLELENERQSSYLLGYALITAVVVLSSLGVGYLVARRVTRRIARLAGATERVAKGEVGFTIPLSGNDEITELSASFNRMIEEVADARDRIVYLEKVSGWQELARRLAHEIKNPLTPIRLAIQELRRRAPNQDPAFHRLVEDATDVVEEEIRALTRLVDEFSQFARLPEVIPTVVELRGFLADFLAAYNGFEPEAKVILSVPKEPVYVAIDRVLMRRVLSNLATNAIQAAGPGTARLWLSSGAAGADGSVELTLEDNGPGVPAADRERVFEPYYTTKADGTGLGLAIVKKLVLQHRGAIELRGSALGGGACFVIHLPAASGPAAPDDEGPAERRAADT